MLLHRSIIPCAAAVLLAATGAAMAQSAGDPASSPASIPLVGSPADFTCAQLAELDSDAVPGVLYFLSGYSQGQEDGLSGRTAIGGTATKGTTPDEDAMLPTAVPDALSSIANTLAATRVGHEPGAAAAGESPAGSASLAAEVDQAGATPDLSQARETSSRAGAADQPIASASQPMAGDAAATGTEIAALAGYFSIPVDDILDQCKASPDSKVSDVMYRGGGGPAGIAPDQAPDE